jgi:NAD(P)H-hydrate epimerase
LKIPFISEKIPYLNTEQMIDVDRAMVEDFKIELIQMMENAGRCLAWLARERFLKNGLNGAQIVVLAGTGGNGGGAMVCARRLHCWGGEVKVILTGQPGKNAQVPGHQLEILKRMGVDVMHSQNLAAVNAPDLIIDGIIGYSLKGPPRISGIGCSFRHRRLHRKSF